MFLALLARHGKQRRTKTAPQRKVDDFLGREGVTPIDTGVPITDATNQGALNKGTVT